MSRADQAVEAQDVEGLKPQVRRSPPQAPGSLGWRKYHPPPWRPPRARTKNVFGTWGAQEGPEGAKIIARGPKSLFFEVRAAPRCDIVIS